ncbi:hypothetical protein V8C43DRAFT_305509 [Trichoderma afarasin]
MADEDTQGGRLSRDRGSSAPPPSRQADDLHQAATDNTATRATMNFLSNQRKIIKSFIEIESNQAAIIDSLTPLDGILNALDSVIDEKPANLGKIKALVAKVREKNEQQLLATKDMKRAALDLQEAVRQEYFLVNVAQLNGFHGVTALDTNADATRANNLLASAERLLYSLGKIKKNLDLLIRSLKDEGDSDITDSTNGNDAGSQ